jgi:chloramphenicol O-acetyltransferase type A
MRYIDMQTWSRRNHFRVFSRFNHPHFNMCVNVDVTAFYPFVKRHGYSFTVCMVYVIARASNAIPEFRQRIRGDQVIEHEIVNPGFSILVDNDLFTFCAVEYAEDFSEFTSRAAKSISYVKAHPIWKPTTLKRMMCCI